MDSTTRMMPTAATAILTEVALTDVMMIRWIRCSYLIADTELQREREKWKTTAISDDADDGTAGAIYRQ